MTLSNSFIASAAASAIFFARGVITFAADASTIALFTPKKLSIVELFLLLIPLFPVDGFDAFLAALAAGEFGLPTDSSSNAASFDLTFSFAILNMSAVSLADISESVAHCSIMLK